MQCSSCVYPSSWASSPLSLMQIHQFTWSMMLVSAENLLRICPKGVMSKNLWREVFKEGLCNPEEKRGSLQNEQQKTFHQLRRPMMKTDDERRTAGQVQPHTQNSTVSLEMWLKCEDGSPKSPVTLKNTLFSGSIHPFYIISPRDQ